MRAAATRLKALRSSAVRIACRPRYHAPNGYHTQTLPGPARPQLFGQMAEADISFMAEDEGMLDGVFHLADIARPVVGHEEREGFRRDSQ